MKVLVVSLLILSVVESAKILAFFSFPSISHQFVFQSIAKELSLRGHDVTFVTPDPLRDPQLKNLTEVDISVSYQLFNAISLKAYDRNVMSIPAMALVTRKVHETVISLQMGVEGVKDILKKPDDEYDLILIEAITPFFYGLQHKFKAPLISVASLNVDFFHHQLFGNPVHPVLYPDMFSLYPSRLYNFWEKIDSLYVTVTTYFMNQYFIAPRNDELARLHFGNDMPCLLDLVKKTSLVFSNVNPIFSARRPLVPNTMEVWNIHLKKAGNLSDDLQDILDNAKTGVVYFSLGTNVRFSHVQGNVKETILQALGQLPYTVLCKWESDDFPGKPKNVVLRKWFPQQSILAHPNIKVFVTQGGLQSSEEAIMNGVPLVVIPFLGDQPMNAKILTSRGMAETILPNSLNKDILADTILKVAKDEKYRTRALELRSIFLDQPQTGLEKIVWWCEYVIRHKGAKHLRSPGADIPLYEYFMLDILAVVLVALFITYKVVAIVLRRIGKLLFRNTPKTELKKKKKN